MTVSETRSTATYGAGHSAWIRLSGTSQEVLNQLSLADVSVRNIAEYFEDGTTVVAVYCMSA